MRTILQFGKYKGCCLGNLEDDDYIKFLAKPVYSGKYYKSLHSTELNWKVPFEVKIAARAELERRGYKLIGERFEK
jgi:hypothetical protein